MNSIRKAAILGGDPVRTQPFASRRTMGEEEKQAVLKIMESDVLSAFLGGPGQYFGGGAKVQEFERVWAEAYGFRHVVSVNSWTSGLVAAIGAVGIEPGDEVICSPYTMSASATCALFYGGIPIFADINPVNFCLDPVSIEARITPRTKAIVVVHLFGHPADMNPILDIARRHDLRVIEDAAQAPGVMYKGKPIGALGDIGGFSLNYHKHIHTGEGGMIVTQNDDLATRSRLIRNHGENVAEQFGLTDISNTIGGNYRLTELQAAIGLEQFKRLAGHLATRQHLAAHLNQRLSSISGLTPPQTEPGCTHAFYVYALKYSAEEVGLSRNLFVKAVLAELPRPQGVEATALVEGYVKPLYFSPVYQRQIAIGRRGFPFTFNPGVKYSYEAGLCPVAERMYHQEMLLSPIVREPLSTGDLDDFADAVEKVVGNAAAIRDAFRDQANGGEVFTPMDAANRSGTH